MNTNNKKSINLWKLSSVHTAKEEMLIQENLLKPGKNGKSLK